MHIEKEVRKERRKERGKKEKQLVENNGHWGTICTSENGKISKCPSIKNRYGSILKSILKIDDINR